MCYEVQLPNPFTNQLPAPTILVASGNFHEAVGLQGLESPN